jgi:hypothetical protein
VVEGAVVVVLVEPFWPEGGLGDGAVWALGGVLGGVVLDVVLDVVFVGMFGAGGATTAGGATAAGDEDPLFVYTCVSFAPAGG